MIRTMRPEDEHRCCELIRRCLERDPALSQDLRVLLLRLNTPESLHERARLFHTVVLEQEREVAGIGGIDLNEIRLLCVDPNHQRRGIGRRILRYLETLAPPELFRDIFVYASPEAAGFYRENGYTAKGEHVFLVEGLIMQTVFMVKKLRPGG